MTRASVPAAALLPLRLFLGVTFLFAGLDKLLDPSFFDAAAPTSLHAQLVAFARLSPLGDLIRASLPLATPIGLVIAVGEIGAGIGALTGLAYRVAAAGGFALAALFWLSVSWATRPYYLGPDLPYALGWLTLAIAGHGDLLVPARLRNRDREGASHPGGSRGRATRPGFSRAAPPDRKVERPTSPERRLLLQVGLLAGIAAVIASVTVPLRALGVLTGQSAPAPSPSPSSLPSPSAAPAGGPTASPLVGRVPIATLADVQRTGSAAFTVPFDAPAPLPAGDPGVLVRLANGSIVAFDAVCTHAGCPVEFDQADALLICPCHGATFDPAHAAAVLAGPTVTPLASLPIVIDPVTGTISLVG